RNKRSRKPTDKGPPAPRSSPNPVQLSNGTAARSHHHHPTNEALVWPTHDDWARNRHEFLGEHPVCPDCGSAWDIDNAYEEEGGDYEGRISIGLTVWCSRYDQDEDEGRTPEPHPISGGMISRDL